MANMHDKQCCLHVGHHQLLLTQHALPKALHAICLAACQLAKPSSDHALSPQHSPHGIPCNTACLVLQGNDFTLFAKTVGLVSFRQSSMPLPPGRPASAAKLRRYIDVLPLNNDWSAGYQAKVAQVGWVMNGRGPQ
jgi:hypothetical protein